MNRQEFHQILKRYIGGNSTDEEKNLIDQWYALLDDESLPAFTDMEMDEIKQHILSGIKQESGELSQYTVQKQSLIRKLWPWLAAACVIAAICVIAIKLSGPAAGKFQEPYLSAVTNDFIEKQNQTALPLQIMLQDSSLVTLQPGSGIKYPSRFNAARREVYMQGEAFFDVKRNPDQPFYVFSKSIVTHVLGTSFNVRADNKLNTVQVDVRTGKVEVLVNSRLQQSGAGRVTGIIITPNQKAVYHADNGGHFETSVTDKPVPVKDAQGKLMDEGVFVFDETPLSAVIRALEKQFAIEVVVDNEEMLEEPFTGDISRQDLFNKLGIVCKSLRICYEIKGTKILLRSKDCD